MATNNKTALLGMLGQDDDEEQNPQPVGPKIENTGYGGEPVKFDSIMQAKPAEGPDLGAMGEPGGFAGPAAGGGGPLGDGGLQPLGGGPLVDAPKASSTPERDSVGQAIDKARGFLVGFDTNKLNDPNKLPGESGKYTPAAKAFSKIAQTIGVGRGQLDQAVGEAQRMGFPNARVIGDDKIDFGDGNGPIDVVRSDGQIVFQNTTGNPQYEAAYAAKNGGSGGGGGGGGGEQASDGGLGGASYGGAQLDQALSGDPLAKIQQLIAQMSGSRPNFAALMQQLGGG